MICDRGPLKIDRMQASIILCGLYLFFSMAGNIAATKVTYFGGLVMDAGFIYSLTFTWRDLIHKQLGRRRQLQRYGLQLLSTCLQHFIFSMWSFFRRRLTGQMPEARLPGSFYSRFR